MSNSKFVGSKKKAMESIEGSSGLPFICAKHSDLNHHELWFAMIQAVETMDSPKITAPERV